jgi:predicted CoA-binding protein
MKILLPDGMDLGPDPIAEILNRYRTIGVVGLSSNPARPSYGVT